ncbi:MAG: hypothetical protein Q7S19_01405 [bacterium]|nr:hypothetical protein [bacterium]
MQVSIQICLRDLSKTPCDFIVETQRTFDDEVDLTDLEKEPGAFEEFIREVCRVYPKHLNLDVYIGWWGNQGTFNIPLDFFRMITEYGWPVTFDIND